MQIVDRMSFIVLEDDHEVEVGKQGSRVAYNAPSKGVSLSY